MTSRINFLSIGLSDVGSTSVRLVATFYAQEVWKISPNTFWQYRKGSSHPTNEIAVREGQIDLATDYERKRDAMISSGRIKATA